MGNITKQSVADKYWTLVKTPAYNTAVFWDANRPTNINVAALGPRDVTTMPASVLSESLITASTIMAQVKAYALLTTSFRRARSGLILDAGGTSEDRTDVCRLNDAYIVNNGHLISYVSGAKVDGIITSSGMDAFMSSVRTVFDDAQYNAPVIDLRVCHSSCHSSCHGSRGRR